MRDLLRDSQPALAVVLGSIGNIIFRSIISVISIIAGYFTDDIGIGSDL